MSRAAIICAAAAAVVAACSPGTSLRLEVNTANVEGVEQLHVSGRLPSGQLVFGPAVRPERAARPLETAESLQILLPDDAAGVRVRVRVEGLSSGLIVASAESEVVPRRGEETPVPLALVEGGGACGSCDGCCQDGRCVSGSVGACGAGGVLCVACTPQLADNCSASGRCQCGSGPACDPAQGANRCVQGSCRCGEGNACPAGLSCDNGVCRCTAASCLGCCSGNECLPGTTNSACGTGGAACTSCLSGGTCSLGACTSG